MTGNANKLREVRAILSAGGEPIEIDSKDLDGMIIASITLHDLIYHAVPEVQGTTQEVAKAKCKAAAKLVSLSHEYALHCQS